MLLLTRSRHDVPRILPTVGSSIQAALQQGLQENEHEGHCPEVPGFEEAPSSKKIGHHEEARVPSPMSSSAQATEMTGMMETPCGQEHVVRPSHKRDLVRELQSRFGCSQRNTLHSLACPPRSTGTSRCDTTRRS